MNINRNNYEEFFLLYADNELSAAEKQAVESFAAVHPDLKAELDLLLQTVLPHELPVSFMDKESLFRTTDTISLVNMTNYEGYFVKYADDELSNTEKAATEQFVYNHPECQEEFELIQQTKFHPDTTIQFPDKNLLYRKTEGKRPVIIMWMRFAAAAVLILIAGLYWLQQRQPQQPASIETIAVTEDKLHKEIDNNVRESIPKQPVEEKQLVAEITPTNSVGQPQKATLVKHLKEIDQTERQPLVASNEQGKDVEVPATGNINPAIEVKGAEALIASTTPDVQINQAPVTETTNLQNADYAKNAASEDYIYVDNAPVNRKSPLRGLLRKASRYVEQKNPLSPDHKKGGVFTASLEQ
ncbi:hypothetical protein [Flavihumibacter fluvii]|uniref:hypothetical protein n=1 Tax=Flavihumibacter fluvii TaxID=2838157 RepID=UPI001BDE4B76|nr:hypothetical protein [Flavihumibacter fluvii]ULQ52329.1 hypothetical protein KJS93_19770 [Flavihumibacter fluvii]